MSFSKGHKIKKTKRHRIVSDTDYFAKEYEDRESAEAEFHRTEEIYKAIEGKQDIRLRVARPVRIVDNTVYFEKITGCVDLRKLLCKFRIGSRLLDILYKTGQGLAQLHIALNPEINSLEQKLHIHGDFHLSNVLYSLSEDIAYIVDFAAAGFNRSKTYSYGSIYDDLSWMIITIEIKYPPHKVYLLARKKNKELSKSLIKGYEDTIGIRIDQKTLAASLEKHLTEYIRFFKQKNFLSRLFWTWQFKRAIKTYTLEKEQQQ